MDDVKEMAQKLVAMGDSDDVPASHEEVQEKIDTLLAKMDESGDGEVTWPEMWDAMVEMVLGDPEADPEDLKVGIERNVSGVWHSDSSMRACVTSMRLLADGCFVYRQSSTSTVLMRTGVRGSSNTLRR